MRKGGSGENSILGIVTAFSRKQRGMNLVVLGRYDWLNPPSPPFAKGEGLLCWIACLKVLLFPADNLLTM
jgi:hypothetical protein